MTTRTLPAPAKPQLDEPELAHIVTKEDQMRGYVLGQPVRALCGVVFTPSRDPDSLPVCPSCADLKAAIMAGRRGDN